MAQLRPSQVIVAALLAAVGCGDQRQGTASSPQAAAATSGGQGAGGPTTSTSGAGGATTGSGGAEPTPTPADCACLAAVGDAPCRACIDAAGDGDCSAELDASEDESAGYCELVLDCFALCPTPDAWCVDTCLGAQDEARAQVEGFTACACGACTEACGSGDCQR